MAIEEPTQEMPPEEPTVEPTTQEAPPVSDNFQYEEFQVQERLSLVKGRLRDLESQHYNKRLDLIVAEEGQSDPIMEQISSLEGKISELREEEQGVQSQVEEPEPPQ